MTQREPLWSHSRWWYWKYVPGDTVLEGLEKEEREARREL